jgi:uncharacterized protein YbbK (DUF523 family)
MDNSIKIGISSCLLGEKVRYDGGHKLDRDLTDTLGKYFTLVAICPEVDCGMTVPREPMHLEGSPASPRLVTVESRIDLTDRMRSYCSERVAELEPEEISGFVCKMNSPSCGLHQVQVFNAGMPTRYGQGFFVREILKRFPFLPIEEERSLADPILRENFIERVFTYWRWKGSR